MYKHNCEFEPPYLLNEMWVRERINLHRLIETMRRLHGPSFELYPTELEMILDDPKEILVGIFDVYNHVVSMAQASLSMSPPCWHVLINNVVTHESYGRLGLGRKVLETLENEVERRWLKDGLKLRSMCGLPPVNEIELMLTNSPKRLNGGFYEACGWTARGPEAEKPTVVWVKKLEA